MQRNLNPIFNEALKDETSKKIDGKGYQCRCVMGIKIMKDNASGEIEIINTKKGGQYYGAISTEEYLFFLKNGWKKGVYTLSLSNYRAKLSLIQNKITNEVNNRRRESEIYKLNQKRNLILKNYNKILKKLNQLNNQ